jgi:hypothetical protein
VHASSGEKPTLLFTSNVFLSRKDQQTKKKKLLYIHTSYSLRCLYTSSTLLFPSSRRQENSRNNKNTVAKARTTSNVQRGSTTSRRRRLLLIIGRRRVVRLLRRRRQGRRCRVEVGGGVMAVVLASEGARVRGGCAHARRPGVVAAGERLVGPRLPHAAQPRRRLPVPVRPPLAVRHHRGAVHRCSVCLT